MRSKRFAHGAHRRRRRVHSYMVTLRIIQRASRSIATRLILYGCGDFLNDYEGIRGYEEYRGDLALMYFGARRCSQRGRCRPRNRSSPDPQFPAWCDRQARTLSGCNRRWIAKAGGSGQGSCWTPQGGLVLSHDNSSEPPAVARDLSHRVPGRSLAIRAGPEARTRWGRPR